MGRARPLGADTAANKRGSDRTQQEQDEWERYRVPMFLVCFLLVVVSVCVASLIVHLNRAILKGSPSQTFISENPYGTFGDNEDPFVIQSRLDSRLSDDVSSDGGASHAGTPSDEESETGRVNGDRNVTAAALHGGDGGRDPATAADVRDEEDVGTRVEEMGTRVEEMDAARLAHYITARQSLQGLLRPQASGPLSGWTASGAGQSSKRTPKRPDEAAAPGEPTSADFRTARHQLRTSIVDTDPMDSDEEERTRYSSYGEEQANRAPPRRGKGSSAAALRKADKSPILYTAK